MKRRRFFISIRIKTQELRGLFFFIPIYPLIQCIDSFYESISLFSLIIPPLRIHNENRVTNYVYHGLHMAKQLFEELSWSDAKDLVEISILKENVYVSIRLL